jgi:predicted metal-dependent peptidase
MKTRTALRKLLPLWLAVLLLLSSALPGVSAATVTKVKKTYDIAVAFDNSGSMYENTNAWCHAKYAMEIFASMLDYSNGDKLTIFPMYDVTTDGSTDKSNGTKLVEIRSKGDIDKIHKLYTPYAGGTPFEPVNKARDYLKASSASEKWLVVLTDGQFQSMSQDKTRKALLAIANSRLRVQYLGVGSAAYPLQASESKYFYADKAATSGDLQNKLIDICNKIF